MAGCSECPWSCVHAAALQSGGCTGSHAAAQALLALPRTRALLTYQQQQQPGVCLEPLPAAHQPPRQLADGAAADAQRHRAPGVPHRRPPLLHALHADLACDAIPVENQIQAPPRRIDACHGASVGRQRRHSHLGPQLAADRPCWGLLFECCRSRLCYCFGAQAAIRAAGCFCLFRCLCCTGCRRNSVAAVAQATVLQWSGRVGTDVRVSGRIRGALHAQLLLCGTGSRASQTSRERSHLSTPEQRQQPTCPAALQAAAPLAALPAAIFCIVVVTASPHLDGGIGGREMSAGSTRSSAGPRVCKAAAMVEPTPTPAPGRSRPPSRHPRLLSYASQNPGANSEGRGQHVGAVETAALLAGRAAHRL